MFRNEISYGTEDYCSTDLGRTLAIEIIFYSCSFQNSIINTLSVGLHTAKKEMKIARCIQRKKQ